MILLQAAGSSTMSILIYILLIIIGIWLAIRFSRKKRLRATEKKEARIKMSILRNTVAHITQL